MAARLLGLAACAACIAAPRPARAQRLAVLQAQERRAATTSDVAVLRTGMRSADTDTALLAIRALGRLERPALVPDIAAALRFQLPELRAEAAQAIAASFGRPGAPAPPAQRAAIASALTTLAGRLDGETVPDVRGAILEAIGRLPYVDAEQAAQGERALVDASPAAAAGATEERLGLAKGFDALVRINSERRTPGPQAVDVLRALLRSAADGAPRVRRLALDGLLVARAAAAEDIELAITDQDAQVRRLAVSALGRFDLTLPGPVVAHALKTGLADAAAMVRLEAVHAEAARETGSASACAVALDATGDKDVHVALAAIDALGVCGSSPGVVSFLEVLVGERAETTPPRGWHRSAHALVALAGASPERAAAVIPSFVAARDWPLRLYGVKAAAVLNDRETLQRMTRDADEAVAAEASRQLTRIMGDTGAPPASRPTPARPAARPPSVVTTADLKRLAAARARITVRDVGSFELALLTLEAPETVLRFARLAESGYYDGLSVDRVLQNFVLQTRVPGAHASVEPDVAPIYPHDELSAWPHVRGALALSSDGKQPGDAQLFVDLVDNPGFDYQYTVFAQTISGLDVLDAVLEGDVIDKVEILP
jgi:peptidyl-prolyl cis-trans isomerase B (cyclophilin B)